MDILRFNSVTKQESSKRNSRRSWLGVGEMWRRILFIIVANQFSNKDMHVCNSSSSEQWTSRKFIVECKQSRRRTRTRDETRGICLTFLIYRQYSIVCRGWVETGLFLHKQATPENWTRRHWMRHKKHAAAFEGRDGFPQEATNLPFIATFLFHSRRTSQCRLIMTTRHNLSLRGEMFCQAIILTKCLSRCSKHGSAVKVELDVRFTLLKYSLRLIHFLRPWGSINFSRLLRCKLSLRLRLLHIVPTECSRRKVQSKIEQNECFCDE